MAILSDRWIREQALNHGMIEPFVEAQRREGCISYGLSSYGYDARVADEFKIFTNVDSATVDPKHFASNSFVDRQVEVYTNPDPTANPPHYANRTDYAITDSVPLVLDGATVAAVPVADLIP